MKLVKWFLNKFKKPAIKREKIRIKIVNDKVVLVYISASIKANTADYIRASQIISIYQASIEGNKISFLGSLGIR